MNDVVEPQVRDGHAVLRQRARLVRADRRRRAQGLDCLEVLHQTVLGRHAARSTGQTHLAHTHRRTRAPLFIPGIFFLGGGEFPPPPKLTILPQTVAKSYYMKLSCVLLQFLCIIYVSVRIFSGMIMTFQNIPTVKYHVGHRGLLQVVSEYVNIYGS